MRGVNALERVQRLDGEPADVFPFFADAGNLERITPPWLGFRVMTPDVEMGEGARIDYRLRLHGVPVRWRTRIEVWDPPHRFVDRQLSGPYRLWHHTHTFEPDGAGGTVMRDVVRYALPFGPAGRLAHLLFVRRDLRRIFDFRHAEVPRLLAHAAGAGALTLAPVPS